MKILVISLLSRADHPILQTSSLSFGCPLFDRSRLLGLRSLPLFDHSFPSPALSGHPLWSLPEATSPRSISRPPGLRSFLLPTSPLRQSVAHPPPPDRFASKIHHLLRLINLLIFFFFFAWSKEDWSRILGSPTTIHRVTNNFILPKLSRWFYYVIPIVCFHFTSSIHHLLCFLVILYHNGCFLAQWSKIMLHIFLYECVIMYLERAC